MQSFKYALTITLKPIMFKSKDATDQFDATYKSLLLFLYQVCNQITLVAELTKNSNIHYHSIITFKRAHDIAYQRKLLNDMFRKSKEIGYLCLKQIEDEPGWIEYISKELKSTTYCCLIRPIVKDDFNIFSETIRTDYAMFW